MGRLLTIAEAAQVLGCGVSTLANAASTGRGEFAKLPRIKVGRMVRIDEDSLVAFLKERTSTPADGRAI